MTIGTATQHPFAFVLSIGLLGGAALIITVLLTTRGPAIFVPYALIVITSAVYLRLERVQGFGNRFALSLGVFMFATVLLYLFIGLIRAKNAFHNFVLRSRLATRLQLLIGAALSAAVAQLTSTSQASVS